MRAPALIVAALLPMGVLYGAPTAHDVRLTVRAPHSPPVSGEISSSPMMSAQPAMTLPLSADGTATFVVPARSLWEITLHAKGWWSAPTTVALQDVDLTVTLPLLPSGTVKGKLILPAGGNPPSALKTTIDVPPSAKRLPGPSSAQIACSVAGDLSFSCEVPAGTLDLSLHASGYIPLYKWSVSVPTGAAIDLGALPLARGSALSGFIALAGKRLESGKGKLALFPEVRGETETAARLSRPAAETVAAANGFFQFAGIAPGRYVLKASYPSFADATVAPIEIAAAVETKLKHPIELQPPMTLTIRVEPPADPHDKEWRVRVRRISPVNHRYGGPPVFDGPAHEGVAVLRGESGGRYSVSVADSSGNPFVAEEFTTAGTGDETHTFRPEFVRVKGSLRRGGQPLQATIWFGGRFGDKHVALSANDRGEFRGVLSHAGFWPVAVSTETSEFRLTADVPAASLDHDAEVELTLPDNHLEGVVVDAGDQPLKGASVRFTTDSDYAAGVQTDADGHFALDGVRPGAFTLTAAYGTASHAQVSAPINGTVGESEHVTGLTLKVNDGRSLHGRVVSSEGPVIGAGITISPGDGTSYAPPATATTAPTGVFDATLTPGFDHALIAVEAPGYALRVFDVALDGHAFTLNVPRAGGTLFLTPPKGNGLLLFQDGRLVETSALLRWAFTHGARVAADNTLQVAEMAPARYRACAYKPGDRGVFSSTRCAEGFLAPFGELRLSLP